MAGLSDLAFGRPLADREIRLIRLKSSPKPSDFHFPSSEHEPLDCTIEYHLLAQAPPYIALSYCWGDGHLKRQVIVNGEICSVGANAVEALLHLHPPKNDSQNDDGVHHFWVDQLCINQADNVEKNHQVDLMWQIYSRADRVVAWLGVSDGDDIEFIIGHMARVANLLRGEGGPAAVIQIHSDAPLLLRASQAFRAFAKRRYWRRLWIIQEFAIAPTVWITCGHAQMEYADLRDALLFFYNRPGGVVPPLDPNDVAQQQIPGYLQTWVDMMRAFRTSDSGFLEGVLSRRRRYHLRLMHTTQQPSSAIVANRPLTDREQDVVKQREPLLRVLVMTLVLEVDHNQPEATNPLDRIFSVLHFADDKAEFAGFPDYGRKCEEVYEDAARRMLMQGHIDVLCYCQSPPPPGEETTSLATWAPDWRKPIKRACINIWTDNLFCASGDTRQDQVVTALDDKTITIRGVVVDRIKRVGDVWDPDWMAKLDCRAALAYLGDVKSLCAESPRYAFSADSDVVDAEVLRTAIADRYNYREEERHPELLEGYQAAVEYMEALASGTDPHAVYGLAFEDEIGWQAPWFTFCLKNLHSRRPFLSETEGYVGLAPMAAQPGDYVVVFLGGRAAYVIRQVAADSKDADGWLLVGECYVHGIMYGELMEGAPEVREFTLR